jgi:deoxyadenosine/deoxycytidine kinase
MIVTIEGNIGAGKSTFLKMCETMKFDKDHVVLYEKVDEWMNIREDDNDGNSKSIFDMFYQDKTRYCFLFQSYVLMSRVKSVLETVEANPGKVIICERSFMTDYEVFSKSLKDMGELTPLEWKVYDKWHDLVVEIFKVPIVGQIYLCADPETCFQRVQERNRQSEDTITMEYLQKLHKFHDLWLGNPTGNFLKINANLDFVHNDENIKALQKSMVEFVERL